jgi:hypothetical protein
MIVQMSRHAILVALLLSDNSSALAENTDDTYIQEQIRASIEAVVEQECGGPGSLDTDNALHIHDFNSDGSVDFAVDAAGTRCSTGMFPMSCGAQFCTTYIYMFEGEYFTRVAEYNAGFGRVIEGTPPIIELNVHGGTSRRLVWSRGSFREQ